MQWHSRGGASFPNKIYKGDGVYLLITGKKSRANQPIGSFVCKSGIATNKTCGTIQTIYYAPAYVPNSQPTFITIQNQYCLEPMADHGDSGGPVWIGSDAWGIVSGLRSTSCQEAIYMASNYLEGGLNVTIKTW